MQRSKGDYRFTARIHTQQAKRWHYHTKYGRKAIQLKIDFHQCCAAKHVCAHFQFYFYHFDFMQHSFIIIFSLKIDFGLNKKCDTIDVDIRVCVLDREFNKRDRNSSQLRREKRNNNENYHQKRTINGFHRIDIAICAIVDRTNISKIALYAIIHVNCVIAKDTQMCSRPSYRRSR